MNGWTEFQIENGIQGIGNYRNEMDVSCVSPILHEVAAKSLSNRILF